VSERGAPDEDFAQASGVAQLREHFRAIGVVGQALRELELLGEAAQGDQGLFPVLRHEIVHGHLQMLARTFDVVDKAACHACRLFGRVGLVMRAPMEGSSAWMERRAAFCERHKLHAHLGGPAPAIRATSSPDPEMETPTRWWALLRRTALFGGVDVRRYSIHTAGSVGNGYLYPT
jgi:hypothetical protein